MSSGKSNCALSCPECRSPTVPGSLRPAPRSRANPAVAAGCYGTGVSVREATPSDAEAIREVIVAAYGEYAAVLPPVVFDGYLADLLDLDARAGDSRLLVAERAGRIIGTVTFFEDAAREGLGWPSGWAGLRALAVDPGARGLGIGRTLMDACRDRAVAAGATVLCLHTAWFMAAAVAIYQDMGFERAPEFDFSPTRSLGVKVDTDVKVIAFRLDLPAPG
jgi:predicted N-acetyltransferase YhbS